MGITNVTFQIWPFHSVISLCICCTFFLSTGYSVVSFTLSSTLLLPSFDNHEDCHSSTTGFYMSLHLIPLGKYKEARLPKDTVFSFLKYWSPVLPSGSAIFCSHEWCRPCHSTILPAFVDLAAGVTAAQRTTHTHICHGCFLETGFHYGLLVSLATSCTWLSVIL